MKNIELLGIADIMKIYAEALCVVESDGDLVWYFVSSVVEEK